MNISEFAKPITSKTLNESLARRFGSKIDLSKFTLEQLQDARNKLRTKLSQVEMSESFSAVIESSNYQKSKLMLDVLNAAISERGDIDGDMLEGAKPDYIDLDGDGDTEEPMKKAAKDKKKKKGKVPPQFQKESIVREGAEDQAEIVMAAKDMVDRVTNWMEDTAEMQTESMLELADAIRDEMGQQESDGFVNTVKPALEQLYAAMESTRQSLTSGVGMLTGEGGAPDMGEEIPADEGEAGAADLEPTVDQEAPADEFAASAPAAGGEAEAGRAKRESIERSRRIGTILSSRNVVIR